MPVMTKVGRGLLVASVQSRVEALICQLEPRDLVCRSEGAGRKLTWANPDAMCATVGSPSDIRVALSDLNTILAEVKKLK